MKKYYLQIGDLYISVKEKLFYEIIDRISEDYLIVKEDHSSYNNAFIVFYAVDNELPFPVSEEVGFIRDDQELIYDD